MSPQYAPFCPAQFSQGVHRGRSQAPAAPSLPLSEAYQPHCMALFAIPDPDNDADHREGNEDGRAASGYGDDGGQRQHDHLAGVSMN
ncbi:hypothetical protein N7497_008724 [Penicillium chrysogenum]|nr:hypothetical protein N7497_008724 [Penicillium chrysogenum]